jgi:TonB family protein
LGAMAANVMYSPAPSYPTAASAARVQGEVKVEAEVDRDGNVTSTRVISGPPLLREAATDAIEHWRYRPYLYDGKPISMSALVVMDFKLP